MSTIDISLGFRHISPQELRNYANLGLIVAGNLDLSEFVEKLLEGVYTQEELDEACREAEKEALDNEINFCSECEAELN